MKKIPFYLAMLLFLARCSNDADSIKENDNKVNVTTIMAYKESIKIPIYCSGKLSTKSESRLSFKIGGIIDKIFVNEGESVEKGQVLAHLNFEEIQAKVDQARLMLEKAKRDYERVQSLYNDSVATLEQLQDVTTQLELAKANMKISNFNLKYSTITAPSKGKILMKLASANEIIGAGHPVFLFGSTEEQWVVKTNLSDQQIVLVQMHDSSNVYFDAYPQKRFIANISEIASAADPYTGTYEVELVLRNSEALLKSGFIAKIELIPTREKEGIVVPIDAVTDLNDMSGNLYVLERGKAYKKEVRIDVILDSLFLISEGLSIGDTVITEGMHYLDENSIIQVVNR